MSNTPDAFVYNATLERIVDGDTFDCCLDLGFDVKLHKQRVRLAQIDTPESRTRNLAEKKLGLAAKARLAELCTGKIRVKSLGKGKYHDGQLSSLYSVFNSPNSLSPINPKLTK